MLRITTLLYLLSVLLHPALAEIKASFDCARASDDIEKSICSNPGLADLDVALAKVYKSVRADADKDTLKIIKSSQRDWVRYRTEGCKEKTDKEMVECLQGSYTRRIQEIKLFQELKIPAYTDTPAYKHSKYVFYIKSLPEGYIISPKILVYQGDMRELNLEIIDKNKKSQVGHITVNYWSRATALYLDEKFRIAGVPAVKQRGLSPQWQHKEEGAHEYVLYYMEATEVTGRPVIVEANLQDRLSLWFEINAGIFH